MINRILVLFCLNFSDRIRSSAMVDRMFMTARNAPIIPVKIAARAVTVTITRPVMPI